MSSLSALGICSRAETLILIDLSASKVGSKYWLVSIRGNFQELGIRFFVGWGEKNSRDNWNGVRLEYILRELAMVLFRPGGCWLSSQASWRIRRSARERARILWSSFSASNKFDFSIQLMYVLYRRASAQGNFYSYVNFTSASSNVMIPAKNSIRFNINLPCVLSFNS